MDRNNENLNNKNIWYGDEKKIKNIINDLPLTKNWQNISNSLPKDIDDILRLTNLGRKNDSIYKLLRYDNHRLLPIYLPRNKEFTGLTYFTRPDCNMTRANIADVRPLASLISNSNLSMGWYIRAILDPRLHNDMKSRDDLSGSGMDNPLAHDMALDPTSAFIPVLTNLLQSISGFPDYDVSTFTSSSGIRKEEWSMIDGVMEVNSAFDMNATFSNVSGDLISWLFSSWLQYSCSVYEGTIMPYMDNVITNTIDYQTRIYRIILDSNKRYVKRIGCINAAFPTSVPTGTYFDFNRQEEALNMASNEINIRFRCQGAIYHDLMLIDDFNEVVSIFKTYMRDEYRLEKMVKIPYEVLKYFNYIGYPRIDDRTMEFQLWVDKGVAVGNPLFYDCINYCIIANHGITPVLNEFLRNFPNINANYIISSYQPNSAKQIDEVDDALSRLESQTYTGN